MVGSFPGLQHIPKQLQRLWLQDQVKARWTEEEFERWRRLLAPALECQRCHEEVYLEEIRGGGKRYVEPWTWEPHSWRCRPRRKT